MVALAAHVRQGVQPLSWRNIHMGGHSAVRLKCQLTAFRSSFATLRLALACMVGERVCVCVCVCVSAFLMCLIIIIITWLACSCRLGHHLARHRHRQSRRRQNHPPRQQHRQQRQ